MGSLRISSMKGRMAACVQTTAFSPTQRMLLSKLAPSKTHLAALRTSAVSSTTTGGLPGPAATTRLPLLSAARTTATPPVATTILTLRCVISAVPVSMVGSSTPVITLSGPPATTTAWLISSIVFMLQTLALGWALTTVALPAAIMQIALLRITDDGFVTGVIATTTPNGAQSCTVKPWSPVNGLDKALAIIQRAGA